MFNQYKLMVIPFVLVVATSVMGCGVESESAVGESIEVEVGTLLFSPEEPSTQSVILPNSLDPSALQPSDLGIHPLSRMSTTTAALVTGPDGALVRQLLKYAVGCALGAQATFDFSWMDAMGTIHDESYAGSKGIAPAWSGRALDVAEQEWVSACLGARTNWYGELVHISVRGGLSELNASREEVMFFPKREGAFWGNLFSATPFMRACYDSNNVEHSRLRRRDCAAGHDENGLQFECGIIAIVGSCQQTCLSPGNGAYYPNCAVASEGVAGQAQTNRLVTVFLRQ